MYVTINSKQDIGIYPISYGHDDFTEGLILLPPRVTNEYMLHLVVKGEGLLTLGDKRYPLKKGALFYCPPGIRLTYHSSVENPYEYYWVTFRGEHAEALVHSVGMSTECPVIYPHRADEMERRFRDLTRMRDMKYGGYMALSTLYAVLHYLSEDTVGVKVRPAEIYVERMTEYIAANFDDPMLKVSHIASFLHVSPEYASKIFREITGETVISYIIKMRLEHAKALLLSGNTVSEACEKSGYDDLSHFSKSFRSLFGSSPVDFVKKNT